MLLYFSPLLAVQLEGHQESEVLVLGPATHAVLVCDLTALVYALLLNVGNSASVFERCIIFRKILVDTTASACLGGQVELGRELLQRQIVRVIQTCVDVLRNLLAEFILLINFGLS